MPFDPHPIETDQFSVQRANREEAVAAWRAIPKEAWDMENWGSECGSICCALGWLAELGISEWHWEKAGHTHRIPKINTSGWWTSPYDDAAEHFGLSPDAADICFGGDRECAKMHGRPNAHSVTPDDVANTLLRLPYHVR